MVLEKDLSTWFRISSVTMGMIWEKQVNVLFMVRDEMFTDIDLSDSPELKAVELTESAKFGGHVITEQMSGDELCQKRKFSHLAISDLSPPASPDRIYRKKKEISISNFKSNFSDIVTPENIARAKKYLSKIGIFEKNRLLLDVWFNKDNFEDLKSELDKYNLVSIQHKFKVHQMVFTPQRNFHLKYVFKPPTIQRLEKSEFAKNYQMVDYIINILNSNLELNIGKILLFYFF